MFLFPFHLGEYKRLVSGYDIKTKRKVTKNDDFDDNGNECGSENKFDDKSINFDGSNCDEIEARREQIKRLSRLHNLAGDAGDIPGMSRIMYYSYKRSVFFIIYFILFYLHHEDFFSQFESFE